MKIEQLKDNQKIKSFHHRKPFWQLIALHGWWLLFFAITASAFFIYGLVDGVAAFMIPSKSSYVVSFSFEKHPFWFVVVMFVNGVISLIIWLLFFQWISKRK